VIVLLFLALTCASGAAWLLVGELTRGRVAGASLARAAGYGQPVLVEEEPERGGRFVDALTRVGMRLTPKRERAAVASRLHGAGYSPLRPEAFFAVKTGVALGCLLLGLLLGASAGAGAAIGFGLVAGGVGFVLPDSVLRARARARREEILSALPNALDLLAVSVEAGLGLDAAIVRYAETAEGPLADELALLGSELRVGGSRADVFRRLSERVPAPETKTFVRAIVHADRLGASLSGTLRTQSKEVRYRRQAVAEEKANRAPVKMLFPTVLCIFPTLFVVVLGPAILSLMESL
jgi:tight adherence protein C